MGNKLRQNNEIYYPAKLVIIRMHKQGFYAISRPEVNVGEPTHKLITEAAGRGN